MPAFMSRRMLQLSYIVSRSGVAVSLSALMFFLLYTSLCLASVTVLKVCVCEIHRSCVLHDPCRISRLENSGFSQQSAIKAQKLYFPDVLAKNLVTL